MDNTKTGDRESALSPDAGTRKPLKYWSIAIVSDGLAAWLFYAWQINHVDGAGNAFLFLLWMITILRLLVGVAADKTDFKGDHRPPGFVVYHFASETAVIGALAWIGYFWTAGVYTLALFMMEGARERDPKTSGERSKP